MNKKKMITTLAVLAMVLAGLGMFIDRFWQRHQAEKALMIARVADSEKIPDSDLLAAASDFLADPALVKNATRAAMENWAGLGDSLAPALKTAGRFRPCAVLIERDPQALRPDRVAFLLSNRPLPLVALEVTPSTGTVQIIPENPRTASRITSRRMGPPMEKEEIK